MQIDVGSAAAVTGQTLVNISGVLNSAFQVSWHGWWKLKTVHQIENKSLLSSHLISYAYLVSSRLSAWDRLGILCQLFQTV
jgi:hypothetical protein